MATDIIAPPRYIAHFDVTTVDGERVRYRDLWQRRILVLVAGRPDERDGLVPYACDWPISGARSTTAKRRSS